MKLAIFGADGRSGVEVVKCARQAGFDVVAFVYSEVAAKNLGKFSPSGVEVKKGDIMNYDDVRSALVGVDAVISVVGHIKGSDPLMQTKGITNIVKVMQSLGVKRILSLTGTGAREAGDSPSFIDLFLNFFVKLVDPERINDGVEHVKVLKNSSLDWTVVRVLKLGESSGEVGDYKLTDGGPSELLTSRKKVAKVLVDLVNDRNFIGKCPVVSG